MVCNSIIPYILIYIYFSKIIYTYWGEKRARHAPRYENIKDLKMRLHGLLKFHGSAMMRFVF